MKQKQLITWRRGTRRKLTDGVWDGLQALPAFVPGRGLGADWPLPPLNSENVPLHMSPEALPALLSIYEEYVDRYLVSLDYDMAPRRWLRSKVPAHPGVLEYVFPLLTGAAAIQVVEVMLIRLVWLIQQGCKGITTALEDDEISAVTLIGPIGIWDGNQVLYRFKPGVTIRGHIGQALSVGHAKVFSNAVKKLYEASSDEGKLALTLLSTRLRAKELLQGFYSDALLTSESLGYKHSIEDKILAIELAIRRNRNPAEVLQTLLVPEYLSAKEFRHTFKIPWKQEDRDKVSGDYLIGLMPAVRGVLEKA